MLLHVTTLHLTSNLKESVCLGNDHFPGEHTATRILEKLMLMASAWDLEHIDAEIPVYMVTDNAQNLKAAINQSNWESVSCFAHSL